MDLYCLQIKSINNHILYYKFYECILNFKIKCTTMYLSYWKWLKLKIIFHFIVICKDPFRFIQRRIQIFWKWGYIIVFYKRGLNTNFAPPPFYPPRYGKIPWWWHSYVCVIRRYILILIWCQTFKALKNNFNPSKNKNIWAHLQVQV